MAARCSYRVLFRRPGADPALVRGRRRRMSTIKDIATRAGVSTATVSYVINGTRFVSPLLRDRVLSAVAELDYRPNAVAQSLRQKRTRTIGLIIPDNSNPFFAEVAKGVEDAGYDAGVSV